MENLPLADWIHSLVFITRDPESLLGWMQCNIFLPNHPCKDSKSASIKTSPHTCRAARVCAWELMVFLSKVLGFWDCCSVFWWGPVPWPGPARDGNTNQRNTAPPGPRQEDESRSGGERQLHFIHHSGTLLN